MGWWFICLLMRYALKRISTSACASMHISQRAFVYQCAMHSSALVRQHTSAYVRIRQHTSVYVSIRHSIRHHTSPYLTIPHHTTAYACVSIRQHTSVHNSQSARESLRELLLLYYCFTTALLILCYCFTATACTFRKARLST